MILVSGQPGAGKSTLARAIADAAGIPHLNRDTIYGGYWFTHGSRLHPQPCWEILLSTTQLMAKAGVSVVLDLTTPDICHPQVMTSVGGTTDPTRTS